VYVLNYIELYCKEEKKEKEEKEEEEVRDIVEEKNSE